MIAKQAMDTILIVDDTPANLDLLSNILKGAGYGVRPAPNGWLALRAAHNTPPDLILLDINMPEMNGFEVCRQLKQDDRLESIPVVFISALTETSNKIEAFKAGGVDYITKPFQAEEVLARVDTHLTIKRYQTALLEKSETLQQTIEDLKIAQEGLVQSEKMASLGVLTAGIAHEINNPINFVKTSAHALKQDVEDVRRLLEANEAYHRDCQNVDNINRLAAIKSEISYDILIEELPRLVKNITTGVKRTEAVINSLQTYSRPDEDKKTPAKIAQLIESALLLLGNRCNKGAEIKRSFSELPPVPVQPGRLVQVFVNVIGNALDALLEDSTKVQLPLIKIQTDIGTLDKGDYAVVRVIDNGPGMSTDIKEKIFDHFFTTKEVGSGMGLGMSISYGIVRDHDGHIEIHSELGAGTTVTIFLPMLGEVS